MKKTFNIFLIIISICLISNICNGCTIDIFNRLNTKVYLYVDNEIVAQTNFKQGKTYKSQIDKILKEKKLPYSDFNCCGWFFDSNLVRVIDPNSLVTKKNILRIYTRYVSDEIMKKLNFSFIENGYTVFKNNDNINGDIIIPYLYNDGTNGAYKVQNVDYQGFYNCKSITNLILSSSIVNIEMQAFLGCEQLKNISFHSNIEIIGYEAFKNCINISKIFIPIDTKFIYFNCFYNLSNDCQIFCENYTRPDNWDKQWTDCKNIIWDTKIIPKE